MCVVIYYIVDGKGTALDAHLVFHSCDFDSFNDAILNTSPNDPDPYTVGIIELFIELGQPNIEFGKVFTPEIISTLKFEEPICNELGLDCGPKRVQFNVRNFLPKNTFQYYYYEGSVTTPNCDEKVRWFVLKDRITLSQNQLDSTLRTFYSTELITLSNNIRPIQNNIGDVYDCNGISHQQKQDNSQNNYVNDFTRFNVYNFGPHIYNPNNNIVRYNSRPKNAGKYRRSYPREYSFKY